MIINSLGNKRVIEYSKLNQKKYREKKQQYIIVGSNAIKEAKNIIIEITTNPEYKSDNEIMYVNDEVMEKITNQKPAAKNAAVVKIEENKFSNGSVIVIDKIQDPGNLGTIIRTAYAFGINNIFIGEGTVDLYNPKVVSAMQGVQFQVNFRFGEILDYLLNSELQIITTFLDEETEEKFDAKFNLVLGNEGNGIQKKVKELKHKNIKIDIKFESLNVAVASGIIIKDLTMGEL